MTTPVSAFGYTEHTGHNIAKIVGYVPVIGTLAGIIRLIQGIVAEGNCPTRVWHIARGAIETLSLGIVWLPVDLIVTLVKMVASSLREEFPASI